jgi:hypothetical protein
MIYVLHARNCGVRLGAALVVMCGEGDGCLLLSDG